MKRSGFSLVEMLVALAVLSILLVALNEILVSTSNTTILSLRHIEADSEARLTLDRISYDISKMVQRSDVDYYFPATQNGNDQFFFYSESTGYFLASGLSPTIPPSLSTNSTLDPRGGVSLVGYRINSTTKKLERLSKGLIWNGVIGDVPMAYLPQTISSTWPAITANPGPDPDFQSLGDGIFRLAITYLVENSGQSPQLCDTDANPSAHRTNIYRS